VAQPEQEGRREDHHQEVRIGPATLAVRKVIIRAFMRWLRGTDEYPEEVRRLKINAPSAEEMPTDQLIEREDLIAMLRVHESPRHKAILAVLHERGLRAGEFCSLHIGSVTFDKYGCVLILPRKTDGARTRGLKTGVRRIRLFEATPYLQAWYEAHPLKTNPKAPLFFSDSRRAPQARMTPGALWKFCNDAGKKAKLSKDVHPHLFRHSAATERARRGWNEPRMRAFFGWSKNSDMPARYTHLAGQDHEKADLEDRGLLDPKERVKPTLSPVLCPACKTANLAAAMFCQACRAPIAPEAEEELERRRQEEIREAAARVVAQFFPDRVPPEIKRLLDSQDEKGHA
jgi:integrase